ncbi:MAG: PilZ domain-containing protein [Candidatus Acidiferrales bacterium]
MENRNRRRSDRISLSVPVSLSSYASTDREFKEMGKTLSVSRYGAAVILRKPLNPVQEIRIRSLESGKEAVAQVVGQMGQQLDGYIYGIAFVDKNVNPWSIEFPPLTDEDMAVSRLLLECDACHSREVVHADEHQTEVFQASQSLSRPCRKCDSWTVWRTAKIAEFEESSPTSNRPAPTSAPAVPTQLKRNRNDRKHVRTSMKVMACIRHPGFGENEVTPIVNISRGGFCFSSSKTYLKDASIEVAVPYTEGGANIFVSAKVVWQRDLPKSNRREYGVAYQRF